MDWSKNLQYIVNILGATALPLSIGDNKTDDEKLMECEARLGAGAVVALPPEHPLPIRNEKFLF